MTFVIDLDSCHKSFKSREKIWFQVAKKVLYKLKK